MRLLSFTLPLLALVSSGYAQSNWSIRIEHPGDDQAMSVAVLPDGTISLVGSDRVLLHPHGTVLQNLDQYPEQRVRAALGLSRVSS